MPILEIPNREQLDAPARDALESVLANLIGYLYTEHKDDGSHGDVTADRVTVREGGSYRLPDGSTLAVVDGVLTLTAANGELLIRTTDGVTTQDRLAIGRNPQSGQGGLEVEALNSALVGQRLRLREQSSYDPSSNDTSALLDLPSLSAPNYSVYRITGAAANIEGIYVSGATPVSGQRGQVLVLINNTGGTLSLAALASVSDEKKIIGGPITVLDDGAIVLVYDDFNEGWQIIASHRTQQQVYGPRTLFSKNGSDQNVSTTATNVFDKTIPANTFNANGQSIHWVASGSWTANGATKTVDPQFAGNTLVALGPAVVNTAGARWWFDIHIHRANSSFAGWVAHFVTHNAAGAIVTGSSFGSDASMDWTADIDLDLFLTGSTGTGDVLVNYSKVVFYPEGA